MLRLIALILLVAIAPAGLADERGTPNRGQSVSECNQRADERDLKGHDSKGVSSLDASVATRQWMTIGGIAIATVMRVRPIAGCTMQAAASTSRTA